MYPQLWGHYIDIVSQATGPKWYQSSSPFKEFETFKPQQKPQETYQQPSDEGIPFPATWRPPQIRQTEIWSTSKGAKRLQLPYWDASRD
ncbi:hypothetical protein N7539_006074 [Penicillium diatomitis]|uniref:Uncharacterized protein n=1 Tax=Penicillium diatomitis TaxID=2819901 RepID=A0A9W9X5Z8_9EURO|nr:uncharacterized protein N7539_006074 [Penicillium diatomitis]KAJ5483874.1 hypothetical protein N7539_006074 [Penicillium diatomitis]